MDRIDANLQRLWAIVRQGDVGEPQAAEVLQPYDEQRKESPPQPISTKSSAEAKPAAEIPQHLEEERENSAPVGTPTPPLRGMITSRNDAKLSPRAPSPTNFGPETAHTDTVFEEPRRDGQAWPAVESDPRRFIHRDPPPEPEGFMRRLLRRLGF
jgi:hypothetical protein